MQRSTKNKQRNPSNNRNRPKRASLVVSPKPPQFQNKIKLTHRFRFIAATASTVQFSSQDIMSMLVAGQTLTVSSISIISAFRLKTLTLWSTGAPNTSNGASTVSFEPQMAGALGASPMGAEPVQYSDTSYNPAMMARIHFVPPKTTPFGCWQNVVATTASTGASLAYVTNQSVGDTMDLVLSLILNVTDIALIVNNTGSPASGILKQFNLPNSGTGWSPLIM